VARYSAIGLTIPSHLLAGWLLGTLLDKAFSTDYLYIVFVLVGVVSGFIEMIRIASRNPD
jgi:F0F1-type ATP synthase assembly protein I